MPKNELKEKILNDIATGATAQECNDKYGIPAGTIRSWLFRLKNGGVANNKCNVAEKSGDKPATQRKDATQRNEKGNKARESRKEGTKQVTTKKTSQNKPHDKNICGAKGKQSGLPCARPAGWGTSHPGEGRCKLHGGCSTGPKDATGNKNAVKHGVYETVIRDRLSDMEKAVFDSISDDSNMSQELRILRFKLLRLLEPVEREMAFGTETGPEIVTVEVDEVTKAFAIEKIVDGIRKVVKDTKETKTPENNGIQIMDDVNDKS
jgi:hypothetical protein